MAKKKKKRTQQTKPATAAAEPTSVADGATVPGSASSQNAVDALRRLRWPAPGSERLVVAGLAILLALNMLSAGARNSGTCDELGAHIPAGFLYWSSGVYSGGIDNFPLGQLLIGLPHRLSGLSYELFSEQHLLLFRLPVMLLGLGVALVVWRLTRRLWGREAALAALLLITLSPNIIAHSTLATLDLPITFFVILTVYLLHRYVENPDWGRLIALALALGAALAVKIQAVLLLPVIGVALAFLVFDDTASSRGVRFRRAASWLLIPIVAVVVIDLVYLHVPLVDGGLLPGPYVESFRAKLAHGSLGHFSYLLGEYSTDGWWYYFPIAILVKTPLPVLGLLALGLIGRPSRETVLFVLAPITLFVAAGIFGRVNIGLRHVLPIYPFLYALAGRGAARLWSGGRGHIVVGGLVLWIAVEAVWIHPHHLSYFNQLAGGATNGHRVLVDSNYDWGQNDRFLRRYVDDRGIDYRINPDPFRATGGRILVNANALYGLLNGGPAAYEWLRELKPVQRIAYTWFEFDAPQPEGVDRVPPVRDGVGGYLMALRRRTESIRAPGYRLALAQSFAEVGLYGPAFEELRSLLAENPTDEGALRVGGELIVRHKLGVLSYRGSEYLDGFPTPPVPSAVNLGRVVELSRKGGVEDELSMLHTVLGFSLFEQRELAGAEESFRLAVAFDPANETARYNLEQIDGLRQR